MKNIQVIDGAENCTFPIFQATEEEFALIFPEPGQDIEYAEDLFERLGDRAIAVVSPMWQRPIKKPKAQGIHGTLYYQMGHLKAYYSGKRERDIDTRSINEWQRKMFGKV